MRAREENSWADGAILRRVSQNCLLGFSGSMGPSWLHLPPQLSPMPPLLLPLLSLTDPPSLRNCGVMHIAQGVLPPNGTWRKMKPGTMKPVPHLCSSKLGGGVSLFPCPGPGLCSATTLRAGPKKQFSARMGW